MADPGNLKLFWEKYGYNVVLLPNSSLSPLQLLYHDGSGLEYFGKMNDLFDQGDEIPPPTIQNGIKVADLKGARTGKLDSKVGVNLLDGLLEKLGLKGGKLSASLGRMDKIEFSFDDPVSDTVPLISLDAYVNDAKVKTASPTFQEKLKNGKVYVITSVLKCNKISVLGDKSQEAGLEADLPEIQDALKGNFSISREKNADLSMTYEGDGELVFALKAARLMPKKDGFLGMFGKSYFTLRTEDGLVVRGEEEIPADWLGTDAAPLEIRF